MKKRVYLAGGFGGNWQGSVREKLNDRFDFFDPSLHELINENEYTNWDLFHVKNAEIVFAYMSATNPSGFGLAVEVGYAKALGKLVILVDEKSLKDFQFKKYFKMVHEASDVVYGSLQDGISYLEKFS